MVKSELRVKFCRLSAVENRGDVAVRNPNGRNKDSLENAISTGGSSQKSDRSIFKDLA